MADHAVMNSGTRARSARTVGVMIGTITLIWAVLSPLPRAEAFKPYTHTAVVEPVLADLADGEVTIAGRSYPVDPNVVASITSFPEYYRAGTIGPDGFPDPVMGQAVIHPQEAGVWLQYILDEAWATLETGSLDGPKALAFAYGYLSHGAADVFAHTMVNEFTEGPFPELASGGAPTLEEIGNALRHIVVESYVADATFGYDGDPAPETLPDGDVSDTSTPEVDMAVPVDFLKRIFTDPPAEMPIGTCYDQVDDDGDGVIDDGCPGRATPFTVGDPEPQRGPVLDYFYDLQARVQIAAAIYEFDADRVECATVDPDCSATTTTLDVPTVRGLAHVDVPSTDCDAVFYCLDDPVDLLEIPADTAIWLYLEAWNDDLTAGIAAWPEFSLQITRGLFDPQARRDAQNAECFHLGAEGEEARRICEDEMSTTAVLFYTVNPFIDQHLLSMMGAPDAAADVLNFLGAAGDAVDLLIGPNLNALRVELHELRESALQLVKDWVEDKTVIPVSALEVAFDDPASLLEGEPIVIEGHGELVLFARGDHEKLDRYLGLPTDHHQPGQGRLDPSVSFDPTAFAPFANSVTLTKLSLLDGPTLDQVMSDLTGKPYAFYQFFENANIMTVGLSQTIEPPEPPPPPRLTPVVGQIDLTPAGEQPNGYPGIPAVSDGGRYVVYNSNASDLVPGDTNASSDVFWHDRETGETRRVSVATDGTQGNNHSGSPTVSGDGRYVVFKSFATNLVPGAVGGANFKQIYRHDTTTGITELVSASPSGDPPDGDSHGVTCAWVATSDDGRFVTFTTTANNVTGVPTVWSNVVRKDMDTGTVDLVSKTNWGQAAGSHACPWDISGDGSRVVFVTDAALNGWTNGAFHVWLWDAATDARTLVTHAHTGSTVPADLGGGAPSFGSEDQKVYFQSSSSNLLDTPPPAGSKLYSYDVELDEVKLAWHDPEGFAIYHVGGSIVGLSGGQALALDVNGGGMATVSLAVDGTPGDDISTIVGMSVSDDDSTILIKSRADNLTDGPADPTNTLHLFVATAPFLPPNPDDAELLRGPQWLRSMDHDHTWRSNRLPVFSEGDTGSWGNFPPWESCVLRDDVFRMLFVDWETPEHHPANPVNFPDYGDPPSTDPNDPDAPTSSAQIIGGYSDGVTTYVGPATSLSVSATDDYWDEGAIDIRLELRDSSSAIHQHVVPSGDAVRFDGLADGPISVDHTPVDPCRTGERSSMELDIFLDTAPPEISITGAPTEWSTGSVTVDVSAFDTGSGLASVHYTLDGGAPIPIPAAASIDVAGDARHTLRLEAVDNLGNASVVTSAIDIDGTAPVVAMVTQHRAVFRGTGFTTVTLEATSDDPALGDGSTGSGMEALSFDLLTRKGALVVTLPAVLVDGVWTASTTELAPGRYDVMAIATDVAGNSGSSASVAISVRKPRRQS